MKFRSLVILPLFMLSLTACQPETPDLEEDLVDVAQVEESVPENEEVECPIENIPEGWWCHYFDPVAHMLLSDQFENYGFDRSGNFIAAETNTFIHVGGFPLLAFSPDAQVLLNEGKLKEYMFYEQAQFCRDTEECASDLIEDSFEEIELGGHSFLKYKVKIGMGEQEVLVLHYATLINDSLLDFSSSEGEQIPVPFGSESTVSSVMIDEVLFESMLETLKST